MSTGILTPLMMRMFAEWRGSQYHDCACKHKCFIPMIYDIQKGVSLIQHATPPSSANLVQMEGRDAQRMMPQPRREADACVDAYADNLYSSFSTHLPLPRVPFSKLAISLSISLNSIVFCGELQKRLKWSISIWVCTEPPCVTR